MTMPLIMTLIMNLIMTLMILIKKVREVDPDSDNISLDSLHIRVLERCVTKYQPPDRLSLFCHLLAFFPTRSKGLKASEGSFRSFGPAGVLRRRLLHRNGTFVPPAQ